jgi:glycosyltransferase involved in cell wall biosynthesis
MMLPWTPDHIGGVNQVVINLYREIERSGPLKPLVLVLDWACRSPREQIDAGCKSVHLRVVQPPVIGRKGFLHELVSYVWGLPATLRGLREIISRYNIRVICAHYPGLGALNFVLLKRLGLLRGELLLSFHGLDIRNAISTRGLERQMWYRLARGADAIVFCSDQLSRQLSALDPKATLRPVTVRNGVDMEGLQKEMQQGSDVTQLLPQRRFILNVAAFEAKKGQDILLRAFARIAAEFADVDLVIIGQDRPMREKIQKMVADSGLQDRVKLILDLPHADVLRCYGRASVFVLTSRSEGLPIALLEAGAFGVPVVASRVDGNQEIINSEDVGILFEPEDVRGLECALRRLLTDDSLRAALGKRLQMRVATEFTWRKAWERYLSLVA